MRASARATSLSLHLLVFISRHPSEPQCSYDPVEGLTLAPDTDPMAKIRLLEEEVCKSHGSSNLDCSPYSLSSSTQAQTSRTASTPVLAFGFSLSSSIAEQ